MDRADRLLLIAASLAFSWLAMQAVHEFGHVLHAWASGGTVERVVLHPLEISRTDVSPNPSPAFVAWGGAIWGCVLPLGGWLLAYRCRWLRAHLAALFAAFCLIANGAYLFAGSFLPAGDAADLLRHGTPVWTLWIFGASALVSGFWLWHRHGTDFGVLRRDRPADRRAAVALSAATLLTAFVEWVLSPR